MFVCFERLFSSASIVTCDTAVKECFDDDKCHLWYPSFQYCLFPDEYEFCYECQLAIMQIFVYAHDSLRSSDVMRQLLTCECEEGVGCEAHRVEIGKCLGQNVSDVLDGTKPINCQLANARCLVQDDCKERHKKFRECFFEDKQGKDVCAEDMLRHRDAKMMHNCIPTQQHSLAQTSTIHM